MSEWTLNWKGWKYVRQEGGHVITVFNDRSSTTLKGTFEALDVVAMALCHEPLDDSDKRALKRILTILIDRLYE